MKVGDPVTTRVRVFSEPEVARGAKCKVVAVTADRKKIYLDGPDGQLFSLPRGDVLLARR